MYLKQFLKFWNSGFFCWCPAVNCIHKDSIFVSTNNIKTKTFVCFFLQINSDFIIPLITETRNKDKSNKNIKFFLISNQMHQMQGKNRNYITIGACWTQLLMYFNCSFVRLVLESSILDDVSNPLIKHDYVYIFF